MAKDVIIIDNIPYAIDNFETVKNYEIIKTFVDQDGLINSYIYQVDNINVAELQKLDRVILVFLKITNIEGDEIVCFVLGDSKLHFNLYIKSGTNTYVGKNDENILANWCINIRNVESNSSEETHFDINEPLPYIYKIGYPVLKLIKYSFLLEYLPKYKDIFSQISFLYNTINTYNYKTSFDDIESYLLLERNKQNVLLEYTESYKNVMANYEEFISQIESKVLSEFPDFIPLKPIHQYLIPLFEKDNTTCTFSDNTLPLSIKVILECAFKMFIFKNNVKK